MAMTATARAQIKKLIHVIPLGKSLARALLSLTFTSSPEYWEKRYAKGGHSGIGSYDERAEFKARVLQELISENGIRSLIDFGCGDGHQISLIDVENYVGLDVSRTAMEICREKFKNDPSKKFYVFRTMDRFESLSIDKADMAISLDVLFHLVEDEIFERYVRNLFSSAQRFVVIYSSNFDQYTESPHVRHREFTSYVNSSADGWKLCKKIENPYKDEHSQSDFFVFSKRD